MTSRMSPSLSRKVLAILSISVCGGSSATNRCASFFEMKRAVDGCRARISSTFSASSLPPPAGIVHAQHGLLAFIVHAVVVKEIAALARLANGPAREAARHFRDVLLRVAAVDAERVQLHQLARVVFVQPAHRTFGVPRAAAAVGDRHSASYPEKTAWPGSWPWLPADRGTCPAHAAGWPRARTSAPGNGPRPCPGRR